MRKRTLESECIITSGCDVQSTVGSCGQDERLYSVVRQLYELNRRVQNIGSGRQCCEFTRDRRCLLRISDNSPVRRRIVEVPGRRHRLSASSTPSFSKLAVRSKVSFSRRTCSMLRSPLEMMPASDGRFASWRKAARVCAEESGQLRKSLAVEVRHDI